MREWRCEGEECCFSGAELAVKARAHLELVLSCSGFSLENVRKVCSLVYEIKMNNNETITLLINNVGFKSVC